MNRIARTFAVCWAVSSTIAACSQSDSADAVPPGMGAGQPDAASVAPDAGMTMPRPDGATTANPDAGTSPAPEGGVAIGQVDDTFPGGVAALPKLTNV